MDEADKKKRFKIALFNASLVGVVFIALLVISVIQGLSWKLGLMVFVFYVIATGILVYGVKRSYLGK